MKRSFRVTSVFFAFFLMAALAAAMAGCSSKKASSAPTNGGLVGSYNQAAGVTEKTTDTASASSKASTSNAAQASDARKIIMSGSISMQTTAYDKAVAGVENLTAQYGGFVQDSATQGTGKSGDSRTATFTLRIPEEKLDDFMNGVSDFGKVISKTKKGQDVTQNYYDTDAHLTTLKAEKARILDILSKTTTMSDLLAIEQRLTDVDNQIEQLTGELQKMDSLISLSTVTLSISEVVSITDTPENFGGQIGSVFIGSLSALLTTLRYIAIGVIAVLPFVVVIGGICALVYIIRRRHKSRHAAEPLPPPESLKKEP